MYFQYWRSMQNRQWYWHLRAANNEIIARGEGYHNKTDCLAAIDLVRSSSSAPAYEAQQTV